MKPYIAMLKFMLRDKTESHHLVVRVDAEDEDHALASIAEHDFSERAWYQKSMQRMVVQIKPAKEVYQIETLRQAAAPKRRRKAAGADKGRRRRRARG